MAVTKNRIAKNLQTIRVSIDEACQRIGRDPSEVHIVGVSKSVEPDTIRNLVEAGQFDIAESRVQQLVDRMDDITGWVSRRRSELPKPIRWHMIGHLQRNKVRAILGKVCLIHSVDSLRLAEEISTRAKAEDIPFVNVLLQVNCSMEDQKYGCAVGAAESLGEEMSQMPHIRLCGLMTMGPLKRAEGEPRNSFRRLRELFTDMKTNRNVGEHFAHLSMGMSNDYITAVEEGATIVRIGSSLFE
ncbi:MAG: YggS family pyridoxal phosphate-dependent enzyme [Phycisphaerales bacterium]|nr:YggS family pyridoxal phosphate-dependent enzyme [Phycisphaerales bacterium]MBT7171231.1 YggS family pyridoxal phosphate-dependent enzyme [Phycisphaerales bacterium]